METTATTMKQLAFPFEIFEEELANPLLGHKLTDIEAFIASLLLDATSENPTKTETIIEAVKNQFDVSLNRRKVKILVRSLRRNHVFPILSRRSVPAGYWWCASADEMKEFIKLWQSQYFDEITTLSLMVRHNFPRLAGQMRLKEVSPAKNNGNGGEKREAR
ncbi:MAG: hypothetical protein M3Q99_16870 [Acidobacteriota bacterium]|nr:hypothetical protein [Acidobacteriota bacterium]